MYQINIYITIVYVDKVYISEKKCGGKVIEINKNAKKQGIILMLGLLTAFMLAVMAFSGCVETGEGLVIAPIGRDEASGTREFFWEHVMNKDDFFSEMTVVESNAAIYQSVKTTSRGGV